VRQGIVSVGIVMVLAGIVRPVRAQQQAAPDQREQGDAMAMAGSLVSGPASAISAIGMARSAPQPVPPPVFPSTAESRAAMTRAAQPAVAMPQASSGAASSQAPAPPSAPKFTVTAGTEFIGSSSYVWRGFQPNSSFSVQPNTWVKVGNVTVSSWMNIARRHVENRPVTEHDLTVDYSATRGAFTWSAGWINYVFPELETGRYSNELYAGFSHGSYLNPTFRVYQDVHEGSGTYVNLGVSHTYPVIGSKVTLSPSLALGYNHRQWIETSTFSDLNMGLRLTVPGPVKRLWLAPFINYSRSLDRAVLESKTYGGLSVAVR
jgi:hypothetical protein